MKRFRDRLEAAWARNNSLVCVGLDPEIVVRRVEEEHPSEPVASTSGAEPRTTGAAPPKLVDSTVGRTQSASPDVTRNARPVAPAPGPLSARLQAMALDLLVAGSIGLGFAAAGSRLLWPVIAIAAYHALGLLLTGTTPMMALLVQQKPVVEPSQPAAAEPAPAEAVQLRRVENEPRHVRRARGRRTARTEQAAGSRP